MNSTFDRKYGLGWPEPLKPVPQRGPGAHEPEWCDEVLGHEWHRTFKCSTCRTTYYEPKEDMQETEVLVCLGDGFTYGRTEA